MTQKEADSLEIGEKVHYQPTYYSEDTWENGIVKNWNMSGEVRIVFDCDNDWDNYESYTGSLSSAKSLYFGWKFKENEDV